MKCPFLERSRKIIYLLPISRFKTGWLKEVHNKLLYIYLSVFSQSQKISGWMADGLIRKHLSVEGLSMIRGAKDDDLFLLLDSDELPLPGVMKKYDFVVFHCIQ